MAGADHLITIALKAAHAAGYVEGFRSAMEQVSGLTANIAAQHAPAPPDDELTERREKRSGLRFVNDPSDPPTG